MRHLVLAIAIAGAVFCGTSGFGQSTPRNAATEKRIATLDTGTSAFFDHRDPAMVTWLGSRRVD